MSCGVVVAGVGGRAWRHTPSAPVVVLSAALPSVVLIVVPGVPKPQTTACCGARCSTIPSPRVFDRLNDEAVATAAMIDAIT
eukprot:5414225-Prymnesium_polylepis.1